MRLDREYKAAFKKILPTLNITKRRALQAMMNAPAYTLSAQQLTIELGLSDYVVANQTIGQLGSQLFQHIGKHPQSWGREDFQSWTMVAEKGEPSGQGFPWKLRPQVIAALEALGFVEPIRVEADEIPSNISLKEGDRLQRWVNAYERNPLARKKCIAHYGCACSVCAMTFKQSFGDSFAGFIHVHHLNPLAAADAEYEVDPIRDLRPVCPNCHAALHFGGQLRTVAELKRMLHSASETKLHVGTQRRTKKIAAG